MTVTRVAIIGAGLSGLYAASLLERQGIHDYVLLDARGAPGGRIAYFTPPHTGDRFDLGPTWFWPDYQRELHHLIDDLDLQYFPQFEQGDMVLERTNNTSPERMRGDVNAPTSMRLLGGMSALTDVLCRLLEPARIVTGQTVRRLRSLPAHIELDSEDRTGGITTWRAEHVLLALPPRLVENSITFVPALPQTLAQQWRNTATWMAPHAKYLAIYDTPFWREQGLSGQARSACGPLGEIHDTSMPDGSAALFGFFGIPPQVRHRVVEDVLRTHCRAQLARLFGPQAATPRVDVIKDWAQEPYTAAAADWQSSLHHAAAPAATPVSGPWHGRVTGIASEWSPQFPGYLAGAIEAARLGVQAWFLTQEASS